ncbi:MAG: energy-coupling factor ABC transporter ATP-binding protein [Chloroflexota bacterium]
MELIASASDVHYLYPDGTELHYGGIEFAVRQGERVVLLGPNGSGKTTLLFLLVGLLRPTVGSVRLFGLDPADRFEEVRRRVGVLLQDPSRQIIAATVRDDIAFSPRNYGIPEPEVERSVLEMAREFEIEHLLDKVPQYLSGGEKTRVALAGALVTKPDLLVLDEPFEGLDTVAKSELATLLSRLHAEQGISIIATTHEINLIPVFVDTVYLLAQGGAIVAKSTPRDLFACPELLAEHHLEPPILASLFQELRRRGIQAGTAITAQEAADALARLLLGQGRRDTA